MNLLSCLNYIISITSNIVGTRSAIMISPSHTTNPLQFKQTSLIRKKINHPFTFPQDTNHRLHNSALQVLHKNLHLPSNSTKFSFRSNSILSVNSFPHGKSANPPHPQVQFNYQQKKETLQEKQNAVQALKRSITAKKVGLEMRYNQLQHRSEQLHRLYEAKSREMGRISESIDKLYH